MEKEFVDLCCDNLEKLQYELSQGMCTYDCYNCEFGILESYGSGYSCSIETVKQALKYNNYFK